jgi:hypothetical protein
MVVVKVGRGRGGGSWAGLGLCVWDRHGSGCYALVS